MKTLNAPKPSVKKVLVVDDSELSRLLLKMMLEQLGFRVEVADSAATAVSMTRRDRFDLILMDYQMPDIDGLTATKLIKKQPNFVDYPALMIAATADHSAETRAKFTELKTNAFLEKPFTFQDLESTLRNLNFITAAS